MARRESTGPKGDHRDRKYAPPSGFDASRKEAKELSPELDRARIINPLMEKVWLKIYDYLNLLHRYEGVRQRPNDIQKFLDKLDDKNASYADTARRMKEGFEKEKEELDGARRKALKSAGEYMKKGNLMKITGFDKSDPLILFAHRAHEILAVLDVVYADKVLSIWEAMWNATRRTRADNMQEEESRIMKDMNDLHDQLRKDLAARLAHQIGQHPCFHRS